MPVTLRFPTVTKTKCSLPNTAHELAPEPASTAPFAPPHDAPALVFVLSCSPSCPCHCLEHPLTPTPLSKARCRKNQPHHGLQDPSYPLNE